MEVGFLFVNNLLYYLKIKGITMLTFKEFVAAREQLLETTSFKSIQTGIDMDDVLIYISPKQGSHSCRIKVYRGGYNKSGKFIITNPDCKIVSDTNSIPVHIKKQIMQFALKNSFNFVEYWYDRIPYNSKEYFDMIKEMKLNDLDKLQAKIIDLKSRIK